MAQFVERLRFDLADATPLFLQLKSLQPNCVVEFNQHVQDGTQIAYDATGRGPVVILVLGALNSRKSGTKLAKLLASRFTAISYDRRGRGDSTDTAPYSARREIEDVAALVDEGLLGAL